MTAPAAPVLAAERIALGYRRRDGEAAVPVLDGFSFELYPREVVAMLGPSGVGKSTLLRVLAGLQRADRGCVEVQGRALTAPHPAVGVAFQDPCLLPWRTVRANVTFGLDFASRGARAMPRAQRAVRVAAVLAEVGLSDAATLYPAELSGGMAQRASLARCLARQPDILLLDEPFAALDAATRTAMQALLRTAVCTHGAAALLVTHDIDEALRVADRVLLLCGRPASIARSWTLPPPERPANLRPASTALHEEIVAVLDGAAARPVVAPALRRVAA